MAKNNKMWVVRADQPEEPKESTPVTRGPMQAAELAEYQKMLTRARSFTDRSKEASRKACRGNSAGRYDQ